MDDCFLNDKERLPHEEAIAILKDRLKPVAMNELSPLENSSGKVLAADIAATRNIPSTDNSAVDGYAYRASDFAAAGGFFPVTNRIAAGDLNPSALASSGAVRIFTGAVMPQGADTVAMQEDCQIEIRDSKEFVAIPSGLKPGANRRRAAEDLAIGNLIASRGEILTPQTISAIASSGIAQISIYCPLRIAVLSSGNELREPGENAKDGQVFDSNRHLLKALLGTLPVKVTDLGIQPDDVEAVATSIAGAAVNHDIIISTGGASRGEEDHIIAALDRLGKRHLWQLAVKPGRPMSFGQIGDTVFFGLPGNPVACFVCFLLYVRPAILRLGGADWNEPRRFLVPANFDYPKKKPDRREFWRGMYRSRKDGTYGLDKFDRDGSGLISGLRQADGLVEIPEDVTSVRSGDLLNFIPWSEFGI